MLFSVDTNSPDIFGAMSYYGEGEYRNSKSSWITDKTFLSPLIQSSFITFGNDAHSNPCFCEITRFRIYVDIFINDPEMLSFFSGDFTGKTNLAINFILGKLPLDGIYVFDFSLKDPSAQTIPSSKKTFNGKSSQGPSAVRGNEENKTDNLYISIEFRFYKFCGEQRCNL